MAARPSRFLQRGVAAPFSVAGQYSPVGQAFAAASGETRTQPLRDSHRSPVKANSALISRRNLCITCGCANSSVPPLQARSAAFAGRQLSSRVAELLLVRPVRRCLECSEGRSQWAATPRDPRAGRRLQASAAARHEAWPSHVKSSVIVRLGLALAPPPLR